MTDAIQMLIVQANWFVSIENVKILVKNLSLVEEMPFVLSKIPYHQEQWFANVNGDTLVILKLNANCVSLCFKNLKKYSFNQ